MKSIEIKCPFCGTKQPFTTIFPTYPLEGETIGPQTVYSETSDALHYEELSVTVFSITFINRCYSCVGEYKFGILLGTKNPKGMEAEDELAIEFLKGQFEWGSLNNNQHDWFVDGYMTGKLLNNDATLFASKPFGLAKFRSDDENEMDKDMFEASDIVASFTDNHQFISP